MRRFNSEMLEKLGLMAKKGFSLKQISIKFGLPKTTVYYHVRKIRGKVLKPPKICFSSPKTEGEVLGIFTGDGSLCFYRKNYSYYVNVHVGNDEKYAEYVKSLFEKSFGKNFYVCRDSEQFIVRISSKPIYFYFLSKLSFDPHHKCSTVLLKNEKRSNSFIKGFLKGLLETDGTIYFRGNTLSIKYYTTSATLAVQVKRMLTKLGLRAGSYVSVRERANYPLNSIYLFSASARRLVTLLMPFHASSKLRALYKH